MDIPCLKELLRKIRSSFDDVNNTYSHAKFARYDEMYQPYLGSFRERKCTQLLRRVSAYPEEIERALTNWLHIKHTKPSKANGSSRGTESDYHVMLPRVNTRMPSEVKIPEVPVLRRSYTLPTSTTRFENYFRYWKGRACGLDYIAPFLGSEDWRPAEVRTG
ncbi:hypothetical protein OESDEN_08652 [Oesophagostomum dentatum]|uniref:Uncharacterized protein n=1 Tax=Oesophagostomum dentatum TaxID=61180 RepID=A0A0B1T6Q8_OESDE|nr:hypothetical protein OESDEN_08652 [Oesophagostomum dentatum]